MDEWPLSNYVGHVVNVKLLIDLCCSVYDYTSLTVYFRRRYRLSWSGRQFQFNEAWRSPSTVKDHRLLWCWSCRWMAIRSLLF